MTNWNQTVFVVILVLWSLQLQWNGSKQLFPLLLFTSVMCRVRLLWVVRKATPSSLVWLWSGYELFGTVCAHMQCAVQCVQQKNWFGNGQHTPSSGWVLYYIATHRACCTSGLNQKLNQKAGTIWKQGGTTLFSFHSVQFGTLSFFWSNGYMKLALQTAVLMTHCCKNQTIELFSLFLHR